MEIATMASKSITIRLFRKEKETRPKGSLSNDDGDVNENGKKAMGLD